MKSKSYSAEFCLRAALVVAAVNFLSVTRAQTQWQPVPGKMITAWGQQVKPSNAWRE